VPLRYPLRRQIGCRVGVGAVSRRLIQTGMSSPRFKHVTPYSESQRAALAADNTQLGFVKVNGHYRETCNAGKASWQSMTLSRQMAGIVLIGNSLRRKNGRASSAPGLVQRASTSSRRREPTWPGQSGGSRSVSNSCAASRHSSAVLANCLAKSSLFSFDFESPETWTITALFKLRANSRTSPKGPVRAA
jgi:hypothetical protein